ncbi:hypothetical protein [Azotobacter beijerinckii]|uniref:Uncharacterized protein n=1 Tax=Azotobacter beijerinckii TaxID=170623 RepID=A0A1I0Z4B6_9GAMM|nr:hypothetical protein [Azotobacter beijerinckii]SFB19956.1 hypothetical protein SAMN04244571_01762 [Azotobacter beijerinckii]
MRWDGHRDADPAIARALPEYADAGVVVAAKAFKRSARTISRIAAEYGVQFNTLTDQTRQARRKARACLVDQIAKLASTRHTQAEICAQVGISRWVLRSTAETHHININSRRR